ncbi:hypothetical protein CMI45_00580 [Candidatus Pacearchaeota archaeon]|nr:hypothetical protein [Candidatus Pacearchaeota archaeon]|tara:strand:+ start:53 stop:1498 length:1446 start_codon:yes stop_codon:yes gene_type:complete
MKYSKTLLFVAFGFVLVFGILGVYAFQEFDSIYFKICVDRDCTDSRVLFEGGETFHIVGYNYEDADLSVSIRGPDGNVEDLNFDGNGIASLGVNDVGNYYGIVEARKEGYFSFSANFDFIVVSELPEIIDENGDGEGDEFCGSYSWQSPVDAFASSTLIESSGDIGLSPVGESGYGGDGGETGYGDPVCGNGDLEAGEECELGDIQGCVVDGYDGNQECLGNCSGFDVCIATESCGDGAVNGNEECDDGGNVDGDGCSAICVWEIEVGFCGDGEIDTDLGEECDGGDGCNDDCTLIVLDPVDEIELDFSVGNAIDSDFGSLWISKFRRQEQDLVLDLGEIKCINSVELFTTSAFNYESGRKKGKIGQGLSVEVSLDGDNWEEVRESWNPAIIGTNIGPFIENFDETQGRFVKLVYKTKSEYRGIDRYSGNAFEVRVNGADYLGPALSPELSDRNIIYIMIGIIVLGILVGYVLRRRGKNGK